MYYLNVMAGPGGRRECFARDHPDHAWIRQIGTTQTWTTQKVDSRPPFGGRR